MFRRVNRTFLAQNLLRARDLGVIQPRSYMMREARPEPGHRSRRHPHAARSTMQIQAQVAAPCRPQIRFFNALKIGIAGENGREARLHHDAQT